MRSESNLINDLESRARATERPLERRLVDTYVWFVKTLKEVPEDNVKKRLALYEVMLNIMLEIMAMQVERIQALEGKRAALFLPKDLTLHEPIRS